MTEAKKTFRRVVTGHDAEGRSCVLYDSQTPNAFLRPSGSCFNEMWTIEDMPAPLKGYEDFGSAGRPFSHSPHLSGCHWRISYSPGPPLQTEAEIKKEKEMHAEEAASGTERKDGARHWKMHRTPSIDYAACLLGERLLVLEDSDLVIRKGDVVIQLGNWHSWESSSPDPAIMGYVMIGGEYG